VGAKGDADPLQDEVVTVLGDDVAAGQPVAQGLFDGAGRVLHALARAHHQDTP